MEEEELTFEIWVGFVIAFTVVGILGNILTLVSVTYAKKNKNHGLHNSTGLSSTNYIMNLAMVDLMCCLFIVSKLIFGVFIYQRFSVSNESVMCKFYVLGIHSLTTIDGWSIALIAFSHAFPRIRYSNRIKVYLFS